MQMIRISPVSRKACADSEVVSAEIDIPKDALVAWLSFSNRHTKVEDYSYITSDYCSLLQGGFTLYFSICCSYGALTSKVSDAFVVALLYYAIATGQDIESITPVSSQLLFSLNFQLVPMLCKASGRRPIRIHAPAFSEKIEGAELVGTGMSAGVDSLSALQMYLQEDVPEEYRISLLTNFNVGSERYYFPKGLFKEQLAPYQEKFDQIKSCRIARAKKIARAVDVAFVSVESNISDIYQGCFERSHLFRTAAAALSMQGFVTKYYISSSGCPIDDFSMSIENDPAHYEQALIPLLSSNTLHFYLAGKELNRIEKLDRLSSFEIACNELMVCGKGEHHCYSCSKEYRTLAALDILGKLPCFSEVFDITKVRKTLWRAYFWLLKAHKKKDASSYYIYQEARRLHKIPVKSYAYYFIWLIAAPIRKMRNRYACLH